MSFMFYKCETLDALTYISKWNTSKVTTMKGMFQNCIELKSVPYISKWNVSNANDDSLLFSGCVKLLALPIFFKWDHKRIRNRQGMFTYCKSVKLFSSIDTSPVNNFDGFIFFNKRQKLNFYYYYS